MCEGHLRGDEWDEGFYKYTCNDQSQIEVIGIPTLTQTLLSL